jgi:signal transduction histidine kinase
MDNTRIAQELYDTLMKGFFAVTNQLHMTVDQLPSDFPETDRLRSIAQLADRVLEEGRLVLAGLRSPKQQYFASLGQALAAVPCEFGFPKKVGFRVMVEGREIELSAPLWEEVYLVSREAIVNAYRHSRADKIEACIEYRASALRISVCDDGCGFDPKKLVTGPNAPWGLYGMRERAARIGGQLKAWSRPGAGTEIELKIPSSIAYGISRAQWWRQPRPWG